jgi:hypothetical protein
MIAAPDLITKTFLEGAQAGREPDRTIHGGCPPGGGREFKVGIPTRGLAGIDACRLGRNADTEIFCQ